MVQVPLEDNVHTFTHRNGMWTGRLSRMYINYGLFELGARKIRLYVMLRATSHVSDHRVLRLDPLIVAVIDDDIEETSVNVEAGQNELLKFFKNQSGERQLIIKVFAMLFFFIGFFTYINKK